MLLWKVYHTFYIFLFYRVSVLMHNMLETNKKETTRIVIG